MDELLHLTVLGLGVFDGVTDDGLHSGDDSYAVPWPAGLFGAVLEFEGKGLGRFEAVLGGEHHLGIVCGELLSGLGGAGLDLDGAALWGTEYVQRSPDREVLAAMV